MRKLNGILLGFGLCLLLSNTSFAISAVRGGKAKSTITASATAVRLCNGPGVVYSVIVSTLTTAAFAVLRDSNTANTTSAPTVSVVSTTTASTQMTLDPPLQFRNGISFNADNTFPWATATYECGVVNQGY